MTIAELLVNPSIFQFMVIPIISNVTFLYNWLISRRWFTLFVVNSAVQTYNAALNRPAHQSSTHRTGSGVEFPARYGNDGSRHTHYSTSPYCAVTQNDSNPWWAVDLEQPMAVYEVNLTTSSLTRRKTKITGLFISCWFTMVRQSVKQNVNLYEPSAPEKS